jgi:hypothetical protein
MSAGVASSHNALSGAVAHSRSHYSTVFFVHPVDLDKGAHAAQLRRVLTHAGVSTGIRSTS